MREILLLARFVSITTGLSLFAVGATGFMLFIAPPGRVAHGGNWPIWGLSKQQILHTHSLLALLLISFSLWHMYFNWNSIVHYLNLKNRDRKIVVFTPEFFFSLLLVAYVFFCG